MIVVVAVVDVVVIFSSNVHTNVVTLTYECVRVCVCSAERMITAYAIITAHGTRAAARQSLLETSLSLLRQTELLFPQLLLLILLKMPTRTEHTRLHVVGFYSM